MGVGQPRLELVLLGDAGATGGGLTCYATMLALKLCFIEGLVIEFMPRT